MRTLKCFLTVFVLLLIGHVTMAAQTPAATPALIDNWATHVECLAATSAPYYRPTIVSKRALGPNEVRRGHPTGGCMQMDLPDREMKLGWVRIESGRDVIYNRLTGLPDRLAECNNPIYRIVPFPAPTGVPGPQGPVGPRGPQGLQGPRGERGVAGTTEVRSPEVSVKFTPPVPAPAVEAETNEKPVSNDGWSISGDVGFRKGRFLATYSDPIPNSGDVPTKHNFSAFVARLRVNQAADHGVSVEVSGSLGETTDDKLFQEASGKWVTKKRDSDDSRDTTLRAVAGYRFAIGDNISLGAFAGYRKDCLSCESYTGQGATTERNIYFQGWVVGAEAKGHAGNRVDVILTGEFGPSMTRSGMAKQTYPGANFPEVTYPEKDAKLFNFRLEADVRVVGPLYGFAAYDFVGISSTRPNTFTASERVTTNAVTLGVGVAWGRR